MSPVVLTVGHSSRSLDELVSLLRAHRVATLVDVRRYPGSRRYPQFDKRQIVDRLVFEAIGYFHVPELGGMRHPRADSENNAVEGALRGYADHMASPEFTHAFRHIAGVAQRERIALMCAEAKPQTCHRHFLSDAFQVAGFSVHHILDLRHFAVHERHRDMRIASDGTLRYGRAEQMLLFPG